MKGKKSQTMDQNEQSTASQQRKESSTSKNGVFIMRGEGQSFEEFVEACVKRFIDAGLIKEGPRPLRAGSGSPSSEQVLPDKKDQQ